MDTWLVSRNPIGFYKPSLPDKSSDILDVEVRVCFPLFLFFFLFLIPYKCQPKKVTFFFKAHIMAGQAKPDVKTVQDFAWLTKQEIQTRVKPEYWNGIKDMLSEY